MIEPTAEMVSAFELASWANGQEEDVDAALAAVLAIVERDRCMQPRGHADQPLAARPAPSGPCPFCSVSLQEHCPWHPGGTP